MKKEEREHKKLLVLGMHANNSSNAEICKALDVSDSFVLAVLKEKGLRSNRKANARITDGTKMKAIELVESGMSYSRAGRILEISSTTVANICREHFAQIQPANNSGDSNGDGNGGDSVPKVQRETPSPISQIIAGLKMMLEGFERLE